MQLDIYGFYSLYWHIAIGLQRLLLHPLSVLTEGDLEEVLCAMTSILLLGARTGKAEKRDDE